MPTFERGFCGGRWGPKLATNSLSFLANAASGFDFFNVPSGNRDVARRVAYVHGNSSDLPSC